MGDYHHFYAGTDYGLDPEYQASKSEMYSAGSFGMPTDPRTANQLRAVSEKLNTGAKTIELGSVSTQVFESIPSQHFEEINRLRKLVGAELTLHAPIVEPTGITKQGWDESQREQAERQMWNAISQGHKIDPKGNVVITFHSTAGLPEPETKIYNEKTKKEEIKDFLVVNEQEGKFDHITPKVSYLEEKKEIIPEEIIAEENKKAWYSALQHVNYNATQGAEIIEGALKYKEHEEGKKGLNEEAIAKVYKEYVSGHGEKLIEDFGEGAKDVLGKIMKRIEHGDIYVRTAYHELKELFDRAYPIAEENDKGKLNAFKDEIAPKLKYIDDPEKIKEFSESIQKGIHLLRSINAPQTLKPLKGFVVEKAAETFSNLAEKAYEEFGDSAPIISIENPPFGAALSRGEDLRDLITAAREKFKEKAVKNLGLSKEKANDYAEKLIGATWDVGHINMMKKYGYTDKQLAEQTEAVAGFVKHVHLSDNFGMEHTELPMGMGNVPTEKMLEIISQYNDKVKKIIETGNWYEHFHTTPLQETYSHFNSPVYAMQNSPSWRSAGEMTGSYFSGYGMNPEIHHGTYGAGFSPLPRELGGQMGGRNRLSGAPME